MKQSYAIVHFRDDADGVFAGKQRPADVEFEHEMRRGGEIEFKLRCAAFIAYEFVFVSVQYKGQSVSEKFFRSGGKGKARGTVAYLFRNYFNDGDEASFKVYLDEAANMRYNYSLEITDELYTEVFGKISGAMSGSSSVANVIASVADAVNAQLDKTMNDVK